MSTVADFRHFNISSCERSCCRASAHDTCSVAVFAKQVPPAFQAISAEGTACDRRHGGGFKRADCEARIGIIVEIPR